MLDTYLETRSPLALNVNDTPAARYLVSRILKSIGIEVVEASTGAEALEICEKRRPELVVLDIRLPDMDGYEVCRRIKENPATSSIAILQTSATFVSGEGKARGLDSGAEAYLTQPFETVELVAMVRSLLRLKRTEQEAEARASALAVADRRKDEFLAMLAHELRNPLSAILVATNLLERPDMPHEQIARFAGTIARQARHLGRLVDDLLDVSRITRDRIQLTKKPFDLKQMVQNVFEASAPMVERRHHRLVVEVPEERVFVEADATRIEQVITNLLANAIKYTEGGGRIAVTLQTTGVNGSRRAVFRMRDSGVGIAGENLESVWDLFYQVDTSLARSQSGLGVGLTMVRRLVEMHGGKVGVRSEGLGHGTEFWFELPTVEEPDRMSVVPQMARKASRPLKILIVDDNVDSCELYRLAFAQDGHHVDAAFDGQEGIDKALAGGYDIAVVDIGLPVLNGYEVAARLHAKLGPRCPFLIALTGYGRPEDRARAMAAGFAVHCVKPLDVREVTRLFEGAARERAQASS
jgi:signal transduction histidine kinase